MPHLDTTVRVRVRYSGWARRVLRVASRVQRLPLVGTPLARLVYRAAWFQLRTEGDLVATPWHWMRVPFPKVSK